MRKQAVEVALVCTSHGCCSLMLFRSQKQNFQKMNFLKKFLLWPILRGLQKKYCVKKQRDFSIAVIVANFERMTEDRM